MTAIELCRTAALGGHIEQCDHCDHQRISYNSCLMGEFRNGELTTGFIELSANFRDFALHYEAPSERSAQRALDQRVLRADAVEFCPRPHRDSRRPLWRMQIQRLQDLLHPIRGDAFRMC
jgi:hypothetical protein